MCDISSGFNVSRKVNTGILIVGVYTGRMRGVAEHAESVSSGSMDDSGNFVTISPRNGQQVAFVPNSSSGLHTRRQYSKDKLNRRALKNLKTSIRLKKYRANVFDRAMTLSGRSVKFHKIFDIPESEILIRTFPCALKAEILFQGTFYVSANYFCFYARLANRRKTIKIATSSIVAITRERTAVIFPNAIGIRDERQKFVFGSVLSRDNTLKILIDLWKAALVHKDNGEIIDAAQTARAFFKSNSDSDLHALQCSISKTATKEINLRRRPLPEFSRQNSSSASCSAAPLELPQSSKTMLIPLSSRRKLPWLDVVINFFFFFKLQLTESRAYLLDRILVVICALVSFCLIYVLYLAYQIHSIQNTISVRLRELLDSGIQGIVDT